jgi:hypothetical protein
MELISAIIDADQHISADKKIVNTVNPGRIIGDCIGALIAGAGTFFALKWKNKAVKKA